MNSKLEKFVYLAVLTGIIIGLGFFGGLWALIGLLGGFFIACSIIFYFPDIIIAVASYARADDLLDNNWLDEMKIFKK